jgi:hypothetical protein
MKYAFPAHVGAFLKGRQRVIRNPAANPGGDGTRDPWRRQDGPTFQPSPWIVAPPSQRPSQGPSPVGTGLFPLAADPEPLPPPGTAESVPGYEFDGRPPGRHRNGVLGADVTPGGRHHRRARRHRTFTPSSGFARPGRTLRIALPVTVLAVGVASGLIVSVNNDRHHVPPPASFLPPATLAGQDFTPRP